MTEKVIRYTIELARANQSEGRMRMVNYVVGGVVAILIILAARSLLKKKKEGGCCGGCSGCSKDCSLNGK